VKFVVAVGGIGIVGAIWGLNLREVARRATQSSSPWLLYPCESAIRSLHDSDAVGESSSSVTTSATRSGLDSGAGSWIGIGRWCFDRRSRRRGVGAGGPCWPASSGAASVSRILRDRHARPAHDRSDVAGSLYRRARWIVHVLGTVFGWAAVGRSKRTDPVGVWLQSERVQVTREAVRPDTTQPVTTPEKRKMKRRRGQSRPVAPPTLTQPSRPVRRRGDRGDREPPRRSVGEGYTTRVTTASRCRSRRIGHGKVAICSPLRSGRRAKREHQAREIRGRKQESTKRAKQRRTRHPPSECGERRGEGDGDEPGDGECGQADAERCERALRARCAEAARSCARSYAKRPRRSARSAARSGACHGGTQDVRSPDSARSGADGTGWRVRWRAVGVRDSDRDGIDVARAEPVSSVARAGARTRSRARAPTRCRSLRGAAAGAPASPRRARRRGRCGICQVASVSARSAHRARDLLIELGCF